MADNTLREALDAARGQHDGAEREVARLTGELTRAREHESRLAKIIDAIESFLDDEAILAEPLDDDVPDETPNEMPDETPDERPRASADEPIKFELSTPVRRKYPSTQMVGELVNDFGRPIHRDEVIGAFEARFGIPPTWDNPRNTLGNALLRAWEKGSIERLDQDYFAPRGHEGALPRGGQ